MIWALLFALTTDFAAAEHDACVRAAVLADLAASPAPVAWGDARTWAACWRSPEACAVEGCL